MNTQHSFQGLDVLGIHDPLSVWRAAQNLAQPTHGTGEYPTAAAIGIGAAIGALVVGVLVVRGAMGYYVGKQINRPWGGAAAGGLFGAPGMGVLALFGKGSK